MLNKENVCYEDFMDLEKELVLSKKSLLKKEEI